MNANEKKNKFKVQTILSACDTSQTCATTLIIYFLSIPKELTKQ